MFIALHDEELIKFKYTDTFGLGWTELGCVTLNWDELRVGWDGMRWVPLRLQLTAAATEFALPLRCEMIIIVMGGN